MLMKILTATALSLTLGLGAAPAAMACGDDHKEAAKPVPADAQTVTLKITGMSCDGCATAVRNALLKLAFVYDATVSYEAGTATVKVDAKTLDPSKLDEAVVGAGFKVEKNKS
jgi:copper chaperone CopZ